MNPAEDAQSEIKTILPLLVETIGDLSGHHLLDATVEAIRKHRVHTDAVDLALHRLESTERGGEPDADLVKAYEDAVINNQVHIALVAALTQKLGYVPTIVDR